MNKVLVDLAALEGAVKWLEVHSPSSGSAEAFAAEALREAIAQPAEAEGLDSFQIARHSKRLVEQLREQLAALLAERNTRLLQVDTLTDWYSNSLDVIREITAALPGAHYMDPPDGGDVSVPEQVRRMAKDAERYRWLLRQAWFQSAFDRYDFDDGGMQHRFERCAAEIIDAALQEC